MFKKFRRSAAANRLLEEQLYKQALTEVEAGEIRGGLWAKALAESSGAEQKVRGLYLKYRVQAMLDEAEVAEGIAEQIHDEASKTVPQHKARKRIKKPNPFEGMSDEELVKLFGITNDSEFYYYSKYKYSNLQDAINYAKLNHQRKA